MSWFSPVFGLFPLIFSTGFAQESPLLTVTTQNTNGSSIEFTDGSDVSGIDFRNSTGISMPRPTVNLIDESLTPAFERLDQRTDRGSPLNQQEEETLRAAYRNMMLRADRCLSEHDINLHYRCLQSSRFQTSCDSEELRRYAASVHDVIDSWRFDLISGQCLGRGRVLRGSITSHAGSSRPLDIIILIDNTRGPTGSGIPYSPVFLRLSSANQNEILRTLLVAQSRQLRMILRDLIPGALSRLRLRPQGSRLILRSMATNSNRLPLILDPANTAAMTTANQYIEELFLSPQTDLRTPLATIRSEVTRLRNPNSDLMIYGITDGNGSAEESISEESALAMRSSVSREIEQEVRQEFRDQAQQIADRDSLGTNRDAYIQFIIDQTEVRVIPEVNRRLQTRYEHALASANVTEIQEKVEATVSALRRGVGGDSRVYFTHAGTDHEARSMHRLAEQLHGGMIDIQRHDEATPECSSAAPGNSCALIAQQLLQPLNEFGISGFANISIPTEAGEPLTVQINERILTNREYDYFPNRSANGEIVIRTNVPGVSRFDYLISFSHDFSIYSPARTPNPDYVPIANLGSIRVTQRELPQNVQSFHQQVMEFLVEDPNIAGEQIRRLVFDLTARATDSNQLQSTNAIQLIRQLKNSVQRNSIYYVVIDYWLQSIGDGHCLTHDGWLRLSLLQERVGELITSSATTESGAQAAAAVTGFERFGIPNSQGLVLSRSIWQASNHARFIRRASCSVVGRFSRG